MTIELYWWSPAATARSLGVQLSKNGRAWASMCGATHRFPSNFGDAVNPLIVRELTGRRIIRASIQKARLVCIGSVISEYSRAGSDALVFGSGMRSAHLPAGKTIEQSKILAVRGKLSARALELDDSFAIGDPGLTIRGIVTGRGRRRLQPAVLPHFTELNSRVGREQLSAARRAGIRVIMPNLHPLVVAQEVRMAECLYTSSLHGLVFADALSVPAQLVSLNGAPPADGVFKYDDYLSVFGMKAEWQRVDFRGSPEGLLSLRGGMEARASTLSGAMDDVVAGIFDAARVLQ